jgi:hypothetical protein
MRNHLAFRFCLTFFSLLSSVLTAAPVLATAQDQSCRKNTNFLLFYTDYQFTAHTSTGLACDLLKKVIEQVQDPYKCTSFAIREKRDAVDFQAIVTMEVNGNGALFNEARGKAASSLTYYGIEVKDAQAHVNISEFTDPKSFGDYCADKTQTTSANSEKDNRDNVSPIEADFLTRDTIDLSDFTREFGFNYSTATQEQQEISEPSFAENVIIEVQQAIGTNADGIWGNGSRKALLKWVKTDEKFTSPEATKTRHNLLTDDSTSTITSDLLALFSQTWSDAKSSLDQTTIVIASNVPEAEQFSETKENTDKRDLTENPPPTTIDELQQENNILKNDHASFSKQIQSLTNENKQLSDKYQIVDSQLKKSQKNIDTLQKKLDQIFNTPILQNLKVFGSFNGETVQIVPNLIEFSKCWEMGKSINDNFSEITQIKNCLTYDDRKFEALAFGHIYDPKSTGLELKLQRSFSDKISSVAVEIGDTIPRNLIDFCGIRMNLNANNENVTINMLPTSDGTLRAESSTLEKIEDKFKNWQSVFLTFSSIEGDESVPCEIVNPNETITIDKEFNKTTAKIDRNGNVIVNNEQVKLKLRSKALTILLSSSIGAPVETSGRDEKDFDYAFAKNSERQTIYFSAFVAALEELLDDQNSKFSKVQIFIAGEDGYEPLFSGLFEDNSLSAVLDPVFQKDPLSVYYISPSRLLKSLKESGEEIGKVITFGSQGTPDNEYCSPIRDWTKYLQKEDPVIDINIVPFDKFRNNPELNNLTSDLLNCREKPKKFILLEQPKYDDGGDTSALIAGLRNAMLNLMRD